MQLRPYQKEAVDAVEKCLSANRSAMLVMATGTGKTIVFATLAAREVQRGGRVLILAHRGELLQQAIDKIKSATGIEAGLEKAESTVKDCGGLPYTIVVASVQSMARQDRLSRFRRDEFTLVVIDECHHALTTTYQSILSYFASARLLGVTATADRGDEQSLSGVFDTIAYDYGLIRAIREGFLSPIRCKTIPIRLDITSVESVAGDYRASDLGTALDRYLPAICSKIKDEASERKAIVFTPLISTSLKVQSLFRAIGVPCREVNGDSKDRAETIKWFDDAPKGSVLVNSMLLTEGYDSPAVDCIAILRPTRIRSLFVQMVGRGTRLAPGKTHLLLLDFLWLTQSHDLCRPACLLTSDPAAQEEITKKTSTTGATTAIDESLLGDAVSKAEKTREDAIARRIEQMRSRKTNLVDPLEYAARVQDLDLSGTLSRPPSDLLPTLRELDELEHLGVMPTLCSEQVKAIIQSARQRQESGLSTPKQIRMLERLGFVGVPSWTRAQANRVVRILASNNWRLPVRLNPATYQP